MRKKESEIEDEHSIMAIVLSIATEINKCCDSIEDAREVFTRLSEILRVRFGNECHVSLEVSHK